MTATQDQPAEVQRSATERARDEARRRVQGRRDLAGHAVAFVVVNAGLILVWAVLGGYFWPIWVIAPWAAGLLLHAWDVLVRRPVTEADVDAELDRTPRRHD